MIPVRFAREELGDREGRVASRWIGPAPEGRWTGPIFMEWELTGQSWTDCHPHDEYAYVIAGHLFVECGGVTVECFPGDLVQVPAGAIGRYWAPVHARMIGVYGPNPEGRKTQLLGLTSL